jgi:hypothetical protein
MPLKKDKKNTIHSLDWILNLETSTKYVFVITRIIWIRTDNNVLNLIFLGMAVVFEYLRECHYL